MTKVLMDNISDPNYDEFAREVERFEAKYGEDWEDTMIEYSNDFVSLPIYVAKAAGEGNVRTVFRWLGKDNIKERVNAKCREGGNAGLLYFAAAKKQHNLASYLLLNGADVNIHDAQGGSVMTTICHDEVDNSKTIRLLLSWGADLFDEGKQMTKQQKLGYCGELSKAGNVAMAQLLSSELGGRRCEIVNTTNTRSDLVGKTCVVEEYIEKSDRYKVKMEFTNEDILLGAANLKRRDRTPQDPGYYVECKNNRLVRRDFKSNEECQAFTASLGADEDEVAEVDPDAEAKAEQAAVDLLAELGLEELGGPSSSVLKKEKQPVAAGKKKKRGGKKKGRK